MSPLRILVADDSHTARLHIEKCLREEGFDVVLATDGIEALQAIRGCPPDLAIIDINMPRLDGYGVCQGIHALELEFPIVFLTSVRANAVKMLGDELGGYLTKPINSETLVQTVREVLAPVS